MEYYPDILRRGSLDRDNIQIMTAQNLVEDWNMGKDRFEKVYAQGTLNVTEIWVDKETGVNYVFHCGGNAGGLTPLLDREGNIVISPIVSH